MKTKKIALTGGIGSGKSYALDVLSINGYQTLSCDLITADLYKKASVKRLLKKLFPTAVSGFFNLKIDRKEISKIAFNDKGKLDELTSAITPLVMEEVNKRSSKLKGTVFVEVPLLFERNYQSCFDAVIVITRPLTERIESVKNRSKLSEEQIVARINNQVDYESIDLTPYFVIENNGSKEDFSAKVLSVAKNI